MLNLGDHQRRCARGTFQAKWAQLKISNVTEPQEDILIIVHTLSVGL